MAIIKDVLAREVFDSRGNPTIACEIILNDGSHSLGFVPSGASRSRHEAHELRDNDPRRMAGKGVLKAVANVNGPIREAIIGMEANKLALVDQRLIELDGTPDKSKFGANAILSASLATAKAASKSQKMPLYKYLATLLDRKTDKFTMPLPMMNILNGGKHAFGSTDFQEFMIVPVRFPSFRESMKVGVEIYHALKKILEERNYQPLVGDEGGFAPSLFSNEQAMELIMMAIKEAGYEAGENVFIALDPAASRLYTEGVYELYRENLSLTTQQMVEFYAKWIEKYPIISIEDGLDQDDWQGWHELTLRVGHNVELIGDDLFATNKGLLKRGVEQHSATGILIKPNQIGTLTETLETIKIADEAGFKVIISHRSGETEDDFIADLAIACGCGALKAGAPCRSERTSKYNRILEVEEKLGSMSRFATWDNGLNGGMTQL